MAQGRLANVALRGALSEAGWTLRDLARAVNAAGTEAGMRLSYDRSAVSHWLAGTVPRPAVRPLISEVLSRRLGRAMTAGQLGWPDGPGTPPSPAASLDTRTVIRRFADLCAGDLRPCTHDPEPLPIGGSGVPVWPHGREPVVPPSAAPGEPATEALQDALQFTFRCIELLGGRRGLTAMSAYAAHDVAGLLMSLPPGPTRRTALVQASGLCFLLARMHTESGRPGRAWHYFTQAQHLAAAARDPVAWAVAVRGTSAHALAYGHTDLALRTALAAVHTGLEAAAPPTRAFLLSQSAVAHAAAGHPREARQALEAAVSEHEQADEVAEPGPFTTYPRAALAYQQAEVLHATGQWRKATAALRQSLRHRRPHERRARCLTHARLGEHLLRHGHVDEGLAEVRSFIDLYSRLTSASADGARLELRALLSPLSRSIAVRAVLEEWDDRLGTGVPNLRGSGA